MKNLTIGEALNKLNQFNDGDKIILSNGKYFDGDFDSYRGYYEDLYLGYDSEDKGFNTIGKLKDILNTALDKGCMCGYKGGTYPINGSTLMWLATYSCCGDIISDIQKIDDIITVVITEDN